jgi:hypothetical protein
MMRLTKSRALAAVLCAIASACHSESSNQASSESNAPAASASAEPKDKLAKALASAMTDDKSAKQPSSGNAGSPPPDGVFEPVRADAEVPIHSPPKVTLGSPGSEPRVSLAHRPLSASVKANLQVALDVGGGQGLPPLEFKVEIRPSAAKAESKGVQSITARITDLSVSVPNVPAEFTSQLKQLVGSKISYRVSDQGGAFDFSQELGKNKNQELGDLLEMVGQGLANASLGTPNEPVGVGGFWMVASRRKLLGVDWIVYDMVKVTNLADKKASLEISSRRYVVGRDVPAPAEAQGQKLTVREANASESSQATLVLPGSLLSTYERTQSIKLLLDAQDDKGQRMLQAGGQSKFQIVH